MEVRMRVAARTTSYFLTIALCVAPAVLHAISVDSTAPNGNAINVARNAAIVIDFDRPLAIDSITSSSLRIWGQQSGRIAGTTSYSNENRALTFTPSGTYFPGEWITVQLAHSIAGADSSPLRSAGYVFQFIAASAAGAITF